MLKQQHFCLVFLCVSECCIFVFSHFDILIPLQAQVAFVFSGTFGLPGSQGTILSFPWDGSAYGYYDRRATKIGTDRNQDS